MFWAVGKVVYNILDADILSQDGHFHLFTENGCSKELNLCLCPPCVNRGRYPSVHNVSFELEHSGDFYGSAGSSDGQHYVAKISMKTKHISSLC